MTRAEERAIEEYPDRYQKGGILDGACIFNGEPYRDAFVHGYEQAEKDLAQKAILFDLWEEVHKLKPIFDFDSTQSAKELIQDLRNIIKDFKQ